MPRKTPTGKTGAAQAAPTVAGNRPDRCNLPWWHTRVHLFDGLEISPCVTVDSDDRRSYIEVCDDPAKAEFWSVYGHYNPALCNGFGGVDCLADFPTETDARAFAAELCRLHPYLRGREDL